MSTYKAPPGKPGQPYLTQNTALAATLSACGVPWWQVDGKAAGVFTVYSRGVLRQFTGPGGVPIYGDGSWTLENAARDAWKKKRPGIVVYRFIITPDSQKIVEGWTKQEARLAQIAEAGEEKPNDEGGQDMGPIDIDPALLGRIACQIFKNRKTLMEEWTRHEPWIAKEGDYRVENEGDKIITIGSLVARPINASAAVRKKLGF